MPIFRLTEDLIFPPVHLAEDGLLAVGGDLSVPRLLLAYRSGIFPWYNARDPILWWSPDPRMVLTPGTLHVSRRLGRTLRRGVFRVTMDEAFAEVIHACKTAPRPGQDGTWITREMESAYIGLHDAGFAHSVEAWLGGELAGGLYGVSLGAAFFGESMFSRETDASKVALASAMAQLARWGIGLVDCQVANAHLSRLGAREVPRERFLHMLRQALRARTRRGKWSMEDVQAEAAGMRGPVPRLIAVRSSPSKQRRSTGQRNTRGGKPHNEKDNRP